MERFHRPVLSLLALLGAAIAVLGRLRFPDSDAWPIAGGMLVAAGLAQLAYGVALAHRRGFLDHFWIRSRYAWLMVLAVAAWVWARLPELTAVGTGLVVLGTLVLLGVWYAVRRLPTIKIGLLQAKHLPGAPDEPPHPPRWSYGWAAVLLLATAVLGLILGAFGAPAWVLLAVFVAGALLIALVARTYNSFQVSSDAVADALRRYAPVYAMPYNGRAGFHIGMWSPLIARVGKPFIVVTTEEYTFRRIAREYSLPVIYSPTTDQAAVDTMFPPSVKAAFYVYNGGNKPFLQIRRVRHVYVSHGDSDKVAGARPISARYDELVVAGQAAIDRYAANGIKIPPEKYRLLGRPQTEGIVTVTRPIREVAHPKVLYAPTWRGPREEQNYSSLLVGPPIIAALIRRGAIVAFRPHPAGRRYEPHAEAISQIRQLLKEDKAATGRPHRWGKGVDRQTISEVTNYADAMISDVSGIVTDFMQSLKPFAMVATKVRAEEFRKEFPMSLSGYVIEGDLSNLEQVLDDMLGDDPLAGLRVERRTYYLGGFENDESAQAFLAYARALAEPEKAGSRV